MVLAALLIRLGFFVAEQKKQADRRSHSHTRPGPQVTAATADSLVTQDVELGLPVRIGNTDLVYIEIGVKDLSQPTEATLGMVSSESVNLLICRQDGSKPRLLLDRKAFIVGIDIPTRRDSLRSFSLYRIVTVDTDGDQRLTSRDDSRLFISDLDGTNLAPVLPEDLRTTRYSIDAEAQQLVLVSRSHGRGDDRPEDQPEELMVFDLRTRSIRKFLEESDSIDRARRILWDK